MPFYLSRFSYTPEAWAALARDPQDRREAVRPLFEAAGCKLHGSGTPSESRTATS